MNLFKKKKKKIEEQLRSRTILSSLYGERWNLKYLENKIKNFKIDAYTKAEVDRMHQEMENKISRFNNDILNLRGDINTNSYNLNTLKNDHSWTKAKANSNEKEITKLKTEIGNTNTKVESNKAEIDKLKNAKPAGNYAELDKENTFKKLNTFQNSIVVDGSVNASRMYTESIDLTNRTSVINMEYYKDNKQYIIYVEIPVRRVHFYRDAISTPKNMFWFVLKKDQKLYFEKQWFPEIVLNSKDKWVAKIFMYPEGRIPGNRNYYSQLLWMLPTSALKVDGDYWTYYVPDDFAFVAGYDVSGGQPSDYYKDIYFGFELIRK